MASEVSDGFRYIVRHTYVTRYFADGGTQTKTLVNAGASRLERFADRPSAAVERCDHCEARLRVTLRSAVDVRRERRPHRVLWKVCALLAVLSGWGVVHVVRTGDGLGGGEFLALAGTVVATVLFGFGALRSLLLTGGFDTPEVTRTDGPEPKGVQHGWGMAPAEDAGAQARPA
ncbi:hypothetical protein AB0M39_11680 [Streptomyces sp. NPDC051907]|uniref:hypothetical protein n=1 Tax=Streptomyces sp. NPDC051907 TaxID=3155284 RepID=UPI003436E9A5